LYGLATKYQKLNEKTKETLIIRTLAKSAKAGFAADKTGLKKIKETIRKIYFVFIGVHPC
jgi:hypothetical protein